MHTKWDIKRHKTRIHNFSIQFTLFTRDSNEESLCFRRRRRLKKTNKYACTFEYLFSGVSKRQNTNCVRNTREIYFFFYHTFHTVIYTSFFSLYHIPSSSTTYQHNHHDGCCYMLLLLLFVKNELLAVVAFSSPTEQSKSALCVVWFTWFGMVCVLHQRLLFLLLSTSSSSSSSSINVWRGVCILLCFQLNLGRRACLDSCMVV